MIPVLAGVIGLALDGGRLYLAHSRLQVAVDAGALAGSMQLPYDPDVNLGYVQAAVQDMVAKNYSEAVVEEVAPGTEVRSVCVQGKAEVDTLLMKSVGIHSSVVRTSACAGFNNLEIVLVIDNTGSMSGTPISMTKQAATNLVNLVLPDGGAPATKVGLVPFRGKVHVGANVDDFPEGCRNMDGTLNEGLLDEYKKPQYRYPPDSYLRVSSDTCSSIPQIQALSSNKAEILSAIDSQTATGNASGTVISEGVKWGRHVLTPEEPYTQGEDSEDFRKIMILLTDGDTEDGSCYGVYRSYYTPNNYWTNAFYGSGLTDHHCEDGGRLNQALLDEADEAKAAGIEIFTIRYGTSDGVDYELMRTIASSSPNTDDHFFDAPSVYDIDEIFKQIGKQLGWRLLN